MEKSQIPNIVVSRLPIYVQRLNLLLREGTEVVSSQEFAEMLGTTATEIRKDLSFFGNFGKQGSGYNVIRLHEALKEILHLNKIWKVAVFGMGNLGQALLRYQGFARQGFEIVLAFDIDEALIGKEISGMVIQNESNLEQVLQDADVQIAILTVPSNEAQRLADRLVFCGINAILSYAPITLKLPEHVQISYADPVLQLQKMTFYLE
ncbi:MAG: redox-sensing transcriptional repressor Rex [Anaerolineaceae bacterium]